MNRYPLAGLPADFQFSILTATPADNTPEHHERRAAFYRGKAAQYRMRARNNPMNTNHARLARLFETKAAEAELAAEHAQRGTA